MSAFSEGVPTVTVQLDKPRELAFTLGTLRRLKEKFGTLDLEAKPDALTLPTYLWACLPAKDRAELSVDAIEDMIYLGNAGTLTEALSELFRMSMPTTEATENPTPAVGVQAA